MPILAATLGQTAPTSVLLRKARRLGIRDLPDAMALAVSRGCRHYAPLVRRVPPPVSRLELSDEELTVLLICGEQHYDPMAIRCAAQLARSSRNRPRRMALLALQEKAGRILAHIALAGLEHDPAGKAFWQEILSGLSLSLPPDPHPALPHWTRFVSMPGIHRGKPLPTQWLVPADEPA